MSWKETEENNSLLSSSLKCHHSCFFNALNLEALELNLRKNNKVQDMSLESMQLQLMWENKLEISFP